MTSAGQNFQATHTKHSKDLCNFIFQDSHTQQVKFPTHISGNTLNLILSADYYLVQDVKHFSQHTSDHYHLSFTIPVTPPSSDSKCFFLYDFKRADLTFSIALLTLNSSSDHLGTLFMNPTHCSPHKYNSILTITIMFIQALLFVN